MSVREAHTPYHPRWYRARPSTYWWLERPAYFAFILREVSSVFVAWFVAYLVKLLWALAHGSGWYEAFLHWSSHPLVVAAECRHVLLRDLPRRDLVQPGAQGHGGRDGWPPRCQAPSSRAANYAAWAVVSAVLAWLLLET